MIKPKIKWAGVFSPFDEWPNHKMQWCVVSQEDRYKLDPNQRESDPRIFGHGDTVEEAWVDYLKEIAEYEQFLQECDDPDLYK